MLLGTLWFLVHHTLLIYDSEWKIVSHQLGWTGERSVPITVELGYLSAISIAQIPVPVPTSKILIGFDRGARCRLPPHRSVMTWCLRSIRSISRYRTLHVNLSNSRLCSCNGIWAKWTRKARGKLVHEPRRWGAGTTQLYNRDIFSHFHTRSPARWMLSTPFR